MFLIKRGIPFIEQKNIQAHGPGFPDPNIPRLECCQAREAHLFFSLFFFSKLLINTLTFLYVIFNLHSFFYFILN